MPLDLPLPDSSAAVHEAAGVLSVGSTDATPAFDVRIDDGLVFGRLASDEVHWQDVSSASIMAHFVADSPVAGFMRRCGANPLRQLLLDVGAPGDDDAGPAP
jgi:hypothetical protein